MAWWNRRRRWEGSLETHQHTTPEDVIHAIKTAPPRVRYGVYTQHAMPGMTVQEVYNSLCQAWHIPTNAQPYVQSDYQRVRDYLSNQPRTLPQQTPQLVDATYILQPGQMLEFRRIRSYANYNQILEEPKHKAIVPEATMMGYIYGFRRYNLQANVFADFHNDTDPVTLATDTSWQLTGGWGNVWEKPRLKAMCQKKKGGIPLKGAPHHHPHRCGINMYTLEVGEASRNVRYTLGQNRKLIVVALTRGWGTVIKHELGYRVEYAEVIALERTASMPKLNILGFEKVPQLTPEMFDRKVQEVSEQQLVQIPDEEA